MSVSDSVMVLGIAGRINWPLLFRFMKQEELHPRTVYFFCKSRQSSTMVSCMLLLIRNLSRVPQFSAHLCYFFFLFSKFPISHSLYAGWFWCDLTFYWSLCLWLEFGDPPGFVSSQFSSHLKNVLLLFFKYFLSFICSSFSWIIIATPAH